MSCIFEKPCIPWNIVNNIPLTERSKLISWAHSVSKYDDIELESSNLFSTTDLATALFHLDVFHAVKITGSLPVKRIHNDARNPESFIKHDIQIRVARLSYTIYTSGLFSDLVKSSHTLLGQHTRDWERPTHFYND